MRRVLLPLCACALAAAGCGSSGGATLTKAAYDAKLSHLCLVAADRFRELHLDNTIGSYTHDARQILRIDDSFGGKLSALKPPDSIKGAVTAYIKATAKMAQDDRDAIAAAKAGDAAKLHDAIAQANTDNSATFPSAKQIGAKGCYFG